MGAPRAVAGAITAQRWGSATKHLTAQRGMPGALPPSQGTMVSTPRRFGVLRAITVLQLLSAQCAMAVLQAASLISAGPKLRRGRLRCSAGSIRAWVQTRTQVQHPDLSGLLRNLVHRRCCANYQRNMTPADGSMGIPPATAC